MTRLEEFVSYECLAAQRYRRPMSLIVLEVRGGENTFLTRAGDLFRGSDKLIDLDGSLAIVMGETPLQGALCAVARYATRYGNGMDLKCGVANFPEDAFNPKDLQSVALRRHETAKNQEGSAIVWQD